MNTRPSLATAFMLLNIACGDGSIAVPDRGSDGATDGSTVAATEGPGSTRPGPLSTTGQDDPGIDDGDDADSESTEPLDVCGDGVRTGSEWCDGADLGGASCSDFGASGTLQCTDTCDLDRCVCVWEDGWGCEIPEPICGNGALEPGEVCDGNQFARWEEGIDCAAVLGPEFHGPISCDTCELDTSACGTCGDGVVQEKFEICEPDQGSTIDCGTWLGEGFGGVASCANDCQWDATQCVATCGNGVVDGGEVCDGVDLGEQTCQSQGFFGGTLQCVGCSLSTASCHDCGDGVLAVGEACDGEDVDGTTCADVVPLGIGSVTCGPTCELVTDDCMSVMPQWNGELVITELMVASLANPEFNPGEWLEVHNVSADTSFDLLGCELHGVAPFETVAINLSVPIAPGAYATLGRGTQEVLGFAPDFYLPPQYTMINGGDTVSIECGDIVVDTVTYGEEAPWPAFQPGVAIATTPSVTNASANDSGEAWCSAVGAYALMQLGTPGGPNDCF
ncbi:MAG: lamin tail domain-containing protein [Nannocystaceae bacterium]|nr:lamin tail domain-containing protein [Nannocystaceae bacterium]